MNTERPEGNKKKEKEGNPQQEASVTELSMPRTPTASYRAGHLHQERLRSRDC